MKAPGFGHIGRTKSPCHGCQYHDGECHAKCKDYAAFVEIHAKEREEIHKRKRLYNLGYGAPYRTERQLHNDNVSARKKGK